VTNLFAIADHSVSYCWVSEPYHNFCDNHNFWTRNLSRSSKVSKDSDCSLLSSKNFSEILPPNGWRLGPSKVGQGGLNVLHFMTSLTKKTATASKEFFSSAYKTCHVFW